mgnify:CR=1 FL=1
MGNEYRITIRFHQKDYEQVKEKAEAENITVSEYIRRKADMDISDDLIRKDALVHPLMRIAEILDKDQCKDNQTVRRIRKEVKKLWDLL